MIEPLFGSASPMWVGIPYPGSVWPHSPPQATLPFGGRAPTGPPVSPLPTYGSSPQMSEPYLPQALTGYGAVTGSGQEVFAATAPAVVAAVAMRRGQPSGPTSDPDIEDFIYDALELLPSTNDVEVRCDNGRTTLTGSVHHKRLKREVGEVAWAIPGVSDVQNNVTIATRRRARTGPREAESQGPVAAARK
jgi:BON domain